MGICEECGKVYADKMVFFPRDLMESPETILDFQLMCQLELVPLCPSCTANLGNIVDSLPNVFLN
jgi:hypothetical protein